LLFRSPHMQIIRDVLYSISAVNVIDMLIIASLIYFVLAWFIGTRSFEILATLIGMGLLYYAASSFGLVLTSVLFQYLWAAIIIVLAIVFQPELREMLERASPVRYLSGRHSTAVEPEVIEETVNAVAELARLRIGALIVFQRADRLSDLLLTGKRLDSLISSEALVMIFQKTSPLHDGAVLVLDDRIKAASCILPLSTDESLGTRFGTRHRAAVGLTERSDAVCVVVSEERGEVSLAQRGEITNYRRKGDFREALERSFISGRLFEDHVSRGPTSVITANWRLKILSLVTAAFLWFVIVGPHSSEIGLSVPIQYANLPPGMEVTGKWMDRLEVRARGSETSLANLKPGSVRALVDLSKVVTGLNFFRISRQDIQVPPGIAIARIRPSDLELTVRAAAEKTFTVVPTVIGAIPANMRVSVRPRSVKVRALPDELGHIKSVVSDPIRISDLIDKKQRQVAVAVKPESVRIESIEPARVSVTLEAKERDASR
jgi:diadenylate cyclase